MAVLSVVIAASRIETQRIAMFLMTGDSIWEADCVVASRLGFVMEAGVARGAVVSVYSRLYNLAVMVRIPQPLIFRYPALAMTVKINPIAFQP